MRSSACPELAHQFEPLVENRLVVLEGDVERQIFALVVATAGGEIHPAVAQKIDGGPLLRHPDGVVQRQDGHRGRETDVPGARGNVRKHDVGRGKHAQRVEMMLADPCGTHADLIGVKRFSRDIGHELVGRAMVVLVMIVAEREIAKIHSGLLPV